jgi:hypothetical protein
MAGIIVFQSGDWNVSSGGFRAMALGVLNYLTDSRQVTLEVKAALTLSVESQLYFLDVSDTFTKEMLLEFMKALDCHIKETNSYDVSRSDNPDLRTGYGSRRKEVKAMIEKSLAI